MRAKSILLPAILFGIIGGYIWGNSPLAMSRSAEGNARVEASITYAGCNEVRSLGKDPIYAGEPGYRSEMDGDGDGIACEPIRNR